ncbi:hypothetical protein WME97_47085 [Sorangium sp. So ce367]|uniref:hypothetical protein n=1 Tax=Sorangium sp. So ce367 TaxID=3133305 RepID=UPI003F5F5CFE
MMQIGRWALAVALLTLSADARPDPRSGVAEAPRARAGVTLAETRSRVHPAATRLGDVVPLLRQDASAEISAIDWSPLRLTRRYGVAATVVRLDTKRTGERTLTAACVVSAAVRELDTGNILFVVEGRARVEDSAAAGERAQRDALRAAIQSAVRAVPDGLRRSR